MAERRMFTKKVTDDDKFMSLSSSAQALYLHLAMSADDDGFSNQVSVSMFKAHASVQDLEALLKKRYIYQFENGVIVIKHWRMANALRKDRYSPTIFQKELSKLKLQEQGSYEWLPDGCQMVANRLPQDRLGKDRLDKVNYLEADKSAPTTTKRFKKPTLDELQEYISEKGYKVDAEKFLDYYESNGWKVGKNPMKDWKATVRNWNRNNTSSTIKPNPNKNKFSNFQQRDDNLDALEKKLLGY